MHHCPCAQQLNNAGDNAERKLTDAERQSQQAELRSNREFAVVLDFYEVFSEQLKMRDPIVINDLEEAFLLSDGQAPGLLYNVHKVRPCFTTS